MQSIKDSVKSFFRNFHYVLLLLLLISLPISLIQTFVVDLRFEFIDIAQMQENPTDSLYKMAIYMLLTALLSSILTMLFIGVILLRKSDFEGKPVCFREIFEKSLTLLPKVWVTELLSGILVCIGLMFFMLPGIILYYIFYMVPYAVVIREEWGRYGLYVASRYPRKHGRKVLGIILFDLVYRFVLTVGTSVIMQMGSFTGKRYALFSAGVLCLQDLFMCIPYVIIAGVALSLPIDKGTQAMQKEDDTQASV